MELHKLIHEPVMNVVKRRYSVRTYSPKQLTEQDKNRLSIVAEQIEGPFDAEVRLPFVKPAEIGKNKDGRIGTYGVIRGAKDYLAAVAVKDEKAMEQVGYILETLILYAASLGIGTCWLGGTFTRSEFAKLANLRFDEVMPVIAPIGYPAERKSVVESLMRMTVKADRRKPWGELFFQEKFGQPLSKEDAGAFAEALEAVRLAPSASNKQPWRIVKKENRCHLFLLENKGYSEMTGYNMQRIDMGIAMCHFEAILREAGMEGGWTEEDPGLDTSMYENMSYIVSWK